MLVYCIVSTMLQRLLKETCRNRFMLMERYHISIFIMWLCLTIFFFLQRSELQQIEWPNPRFTGTLELEDFVCDEYSK